MFETIRVDGETGPVTRIVLARPPLNILNIRMLEELADAVDAHATRADLRVLVIAAEGKAFSAGVDIADHTAERVRPMIAAFHGLFRRLAACAPVTVAEVRGAALGGGCELAGCCDLVLAADTARFGQPEIALALFPPVTAAAFPALMPARKVLDLMLTGEIFDAAEAERIGLVSRVFPAAGFATDAAAFVTSLAARSGVALRLAKKAWRAALGVSFDEALDRAEEIYLNELMRTRDAHEGIAAFVEKRAAVWEDR
ncbi:MAG: enoyl-CoA hydratase/isomerase family protein [Gemmatimonadota bacterium]